MINIFGWTIVRTEEVERLKDLETKPIEFVADYTPAKGSYSCGYSNCHFESGTERGLKIHRARVHKKK